MAYTVGMTDYTIKQAAELLGLSKGGVRKRIEKLDLMDELVRTDGPQGKILIPVHVLHELDTEHRIFGYREVPTENTHLNDDFADTTQPLTDDHTQGMQEETGDNLDTEQVQYSILANQITGLVSTVNVLQETITTMQDTISRQSVTIDNLLADLREKDKKLQEAAKQSQEQTQTNVFPTDPEETQGHVSWWKRLFG